MPSHLLAVKCKGNHEYSISSNNERSWRQVVLAANSEYFHTLFCTQLNDNAGETVFFGEGNPAAERMEVSVGAVGRRKISILSFLALQYFGDFYSFTV